MFSAGARPSLHASRLLESRNFNGRGVRWAAVPLGESAEDRELKFQKQTLHFFDGNVCCVLYEPSLDALSFVPVLVPNIGAATPRLNRVRDRQTRDHC